MFDILVIGSGIAGLSFALKVAEECRVAVVTKKEKVETSTNYAQGGIASVLGPDDSFDLHIQDTIQSGDGLCHADVVEMVVKNGPARIQELAEMGVHFNMGKRANSSFDLGREGGHSRSRIVHAHDMTGREVERVLVAMAEEHPNIEIFENHIAIDLITECHFFKRGLLTTRRRVRCWGAHILDIQGNRIVTFLAQNTLLCTGGAGKVYIYTSNPDVATGDGVAMAYRAGALIANMEFVQFHPTCLYHPHAKNFLISEALRGEGGRLIDRRGHRFMDKYHPLGDLACRDVVARAIDTEMKQSGDDCVYLDISHREADFLEKRFPNIYDKCLSLGIDMTREPIPVVPAAHYMCGGILTDKQGRTSIEHLYALGESACTGLHGANRLASNSLLEALVFAHNAALDINRRTETAKKEPLPEIPPLEMDFLSNRSEMVLIAYNWDIIRRLMWNYVGIVRTNNRLRLAQNHLVQIHREINEHYPNISLNSDLIELRNLATVAQIIVTCARSRTESRGLHYNLDHPRKDDEHWLHDTVTRLGDQQMFSG
ncbi:MAG: L-aspartate oxidase [Deltaproteobacteria bacterium]|nr:L-aspartate oxidase [Deltaproteobacteria bacterium]MBW2070856.1 L-aspartate oxidase [Deltaproteobacteria bacterium]